METEASRELLPRPHKTSRTVLQNGHDVEASDTIDNVVSFRQEDAEAIDLYWQQLVQDRSGQKTPSTP